MFRVFDGATADAVWCEMAYAFRNGEGVSQPSRIGEMREILHSAMSISDPTQRWVTSREPTINLAFALAEVVWIVNGRNDSAFLNYFNRRLPKFAGFGATYHGAYGHRLRSNIGIDQLQRAYEVLNAKPTSRQIVLQIWDGRIDLPQRTGEEISSDVPCNVVSILKIRSGKLEWMQIMRSNDIYLGLPYNIVQFTTLQEVVAGWLNLELGEYNQISNSLHVYERDLVNVLRSHPKPCATNTDSLALPKKESEKAFVELADNIEAIINPSVSVNSLFSLFHNSKLPPAFKNMLCVLCAEGIRRRQRHQALNDLLSECTNLIYNQLYDQWLVRCGIGDDSRQAAIVR